MNMRNGKVQFVLVAVLLMVAVIWLFPSMTEGKSKAPPWQSSEEQRDGYSRSFIVDANSVLLEVPEGKCYVLLSLYAKYVDYEQPYFDDWGEGWGNSAWTLTIDGELFFNEFILNGASANTCCIAREYFPDKCVVIKGGQILEITKDKNVEQVQMALIGYFYNTP
jgi:hypothetical protein